jgi:ribonuclease P/MRP protein subunit POP1
VPAPAYAEALDLLADADTDGGVVVCGRRGELLRFELTGPQATDVLRRALAPERTDAATRRQQEAWDSITAVGSAASFRRRAVLSLLVVDPRLTACAQGRPARPPAAPTTAAERADQLVAQRKCVELMATWPSGVAVSTVWDEATRAAVKDAHVPVKVLNERRQQARTPGAVLAPTAADARVPILLVQRPGAAPFTSGGGRATRTTNREGQPSRAGISQHACHQPRGCQSGYGSGWDIIVPAGWGMAFWLAFVYGGGRAIGLHERRAMSLEKGVPSFPYDYPDTASCRVEAAAEAAEARKKYNRRPPKRRVNYARVGVPTPFHVEWAALAGLSHTTERQWTACEQERAVRVTRLYDGLLQQIVTTRALVMAAEVDIPALIGTLLCVHVSVGGRGVPRPNATVYAPTDADLQAYSRSPTLLGPR